MKNTFNYTKNVRAFRRQITWTTHTSHPKKCSSKTFPAITLQNLTHFSHINTRNTKDNTNQGIITILINIRFQYTRLFIFVLNFTFYCFYLISRVQCIVTTIYVQKRVKLARGVFQTRVFSEIHKRKVKVKR